MSVHEFRGRNAHSKFIAVLVHGGGQTHYSKDHPLVTLVQDFVSIIYSVELPVHGKHSAMILQDPVQDSIDIVYTLLEPIVRDRNVLFISFSVGGLIILKNWSKLVSLTSKHVGIFIGCGIVGNHADAKRWEQFWAKDVIQAQKRDVIMQKLHGDDWPNTAQFVQFTTTSDPEMKMYCNEKERSSILADSKNVVFMIGSEEQVFNMESAILNSLSYQERTNFINSRSLVEVHKVDHFSYFSKGWPQLEKLLKQEILRRLHDTIQANL
jgi:hypothetical protein